MFYLRYLCLKDVQFVLNTTSVFSVPLLDVVGQSDTNDSLVVFISL